MRRGESREALWVLEEGSGGADTLAPRLRALGFAARALRSPAALCEGLAASEAGPAAPRGLFLSVALPDRALEAALRLLTPLLDSACTTAVAFGRKPPGPGRRRRLAEAGLALGLFGAFDDATLRFQANRAFLRLRPRGRARRDLRAPGGALARLRVRGRERCARAYSLSAGGAYLETPRPAPRGARLEIELEGEPACAPLRAEVLHTNVPGNLRRPLLPAGMGVRFEEPRASRAALEARVRARSAELVL